ncbi:hypothetical protein KSP39_PZI023882 [Platanthera zijinensis]|uniref:Uncharacterized protein n=1 Tax=Platanthera zijinensis TaxID=2320716 RepID=A0AAP0FU46_9ASPA
MLDRSLTISEKEKEKIKDPLRIAVTAAADDANKKAAPRPINSLSCAVTAGSAVAHRREQDREREKWKRFSEPVGLVNRSIMAVSVNEKIKGNMNSEVREDGVEKDEKGKKSLVLDSQSGSSQQE